jgi:transposase
MARGRQSSCIVFLSPAERAQLEHRQRSTTFQAGLAKRAKIILWRADGQPLSEIARRLELGRRIVRQWVQRFLNQRMAGLADNLATVASQYVPPEVAVHLVKMACERPDQLGRSLSSWDGRELARPLEHQGIVEHISADTVRRLLVHHKLTPWRHHLWLSPTTPRDAAFCARVAAVVALYIRPLRDDEMVFSVDEKTSLQPRPRLHATRPAIPGWPNQVEHEYTRDGALNLWAGLDTRTGRV